MLVRERSIGRRRMPRNASAPMRGRLICSNTLASTACLGDVWAPANSYCAGRSLSVQYDREGPPRVRQPHVGGAETGAGVHRKARAESVGVWVCGSMGVWVWETGFYTHTPILPYSPRTLARAA